MLLLITPLWAGAATSTLTLPEEPTTEGEVVEIEWQPLEAGTYRILIERTDTPNATEVATFVVKALPPLPAPEVQGTSTTNVESSAKIQETIANILPQIAVAAPVFGAIDSLRQKGVDVLLAGEVWAESKTAKPQGEVAGEETGEDGGGSGIANTVMQMVATLLLYLFGALKFVLSNAGIFYPVLAVAFFYLLWRLFKKMRRS